MLVGLVLVAALAIGIAVLGGDDEPSAGPASTTSTTSFDQGIDTRTYEVVPSRTAATASDRAVAGALLRDVRSAVRRHGWTRPAQARADGYRPLEGDPEHWFSKAALADGRTFDVDRPEFLMFHDGALAGFMFSTDSLDLHQAAPPGSPVVRWHFHQWAFPLCVEHGFVADRRATKDTPCPAGSTASDHSPLMAHVWLMEGMEPFALDMDPSHGGDEANGTVQEAELAGGSPPPRVVNPPG